MLSHKLRRYKAPAVSNTDPNFKQVSLLLHGDGTNGAQNNTFLDSSTNNFTVTRNGNTTQGTNTPFSQAAGYWSNYIPSTAGTCLKAGTSTSLALGSGDFTVEEYVYINAAASSYSVYLDWRTNGGNINTMPILIDINNNGKIAFIVGTGSGLTTIVESTSTVPLKQWIHVAVVRSGTTVTMYFNGTSVGTGTSSVNFGIETLNISNPQSGNYNPDFYVSNFRIVKGTAVYTSAFTPPTIPLTAVTNTVLLTCQSNYFKDNSSNNFALTATGTPSVQPFSPFAPTSAYSTSVNGGSMYFDGTGDYLQVASNASFAFGTNDYTMECWVYPQNTASDFFNGGSDLCNFGYQSGQFFFYTGALNNFGALVLNQWNHIAASRVSGTLNCYLNGVRGFTASNTTNYSNQTIRIGINNNGFSNPLLGFLSNTRILKGTGLYSGTTITVPTAPLTAITNTSLLLSGTNAGIVDNAIKNDLETVGNAQVSTSVKKFGTGSMKFNGTTDFLTIPPNTNLDLGSGNFTLECWFYHSSNALQYVVEISSPTHGFAQAAFAVTGSQVYGLIGNTAGGGTWQTVLVGGSYTQNTWNHYALVRNGSTATIYLNGVSVGSGAVSGTLYYTGIQASIIGDYAPSGYKFNGYIDDLRITKGIARYTANFTAPTEAFPNQ